MTKSITSIIIYIIVLLVSFSSFSQKKPLVKRKSKAEIRDEKQEFIDQALSKHIKLMGQIIYFSDHIGDLDKKKEHIPAKKAKLDANIDKEISRLQKLKTDADSIHLDSVISFYKKIKKSINEEYSAVTQLRMSLKFNHEQVFQFVHSLGKADKNIVAAETYMYNLNKNFSRRHRVKLDKEFDDLHKKVIANEKAIWYHNTMLLQFYRIYMIESEKFVSQKSEIADTSQNEKYVKFADEVFAAEDTINMKGVFEGDGSFSFAIREYFKYIRNQYFENFGFYSQYMKNVERKRLETNKAKKTGKVTNSVKKHDQNLRAAQNLLRASFGNMKDQRGDLVSFVEETSFDFLYTHCPKFKR